MELEFDKEIDALLRKARSGTSAAAPISKSNSGHLDADAIAAFAEGAVPDAIRKTYTAHLADCDSCRRALSRVALLNEPVALKAVAAGAGAAAMMAAPRSAATTKTAPWYRPLFRSPGLAAAFGLLVLAFGGVLVYFVTQRQTTNDSVAMQTANNANAAVPYSGIEANSAANGAAAVSNTAASTGASNSANVARSEHETANTSTTTRSANSSVGTGSGNGGAMSSAPVIVGAAPPPAAAGQPSSVAGVAAEKPKDEAKTESRDDKETALRDRALSEDGLARAETRGAENAKKAAGTTRGAGPVQNQTQMNTMSTDMAVTRRIGGKTFHNSNGAWYDSAYHGQSTTNVRRVSDDFKKLDSGLRSIANDLSGIVVVVWKDKAYRIQ